MARQTKLADLHWGSILRHGWTRERRSAKTRPRRVTTSPKPNRSTGLVTARESDPDLGFQARMMALCSLPRSNPGQRKEYVRRNGPYTLGMSAGIGNKLPFGTLPRLLMAWVSTEAVKTQSPVLVLGNSLTEFMNKLGINSDSSGRRGERTRLRNQMDRLFNSTVQFIYEPKAPDGASLGVKDTFNSTVARKTHLVWNPKKPNEPVLWESTVELGHDFFHDILRHPFPLDMNILKALKKSPLGLDFYMWAVYRTFSLTRPLRLSWPALYQQFGADPSRANDKLHRRHDFRKDCRARAQEDQARLAGAELLARKGRVGLRSLKARDSAQRPMTPFAPSKMCCHQMFGAGTRVESSGHGGWALCVGLLSPQSFRRLAGHAHGGSCGGV